MAASAVAKLTVVKLREELKARGLDTTGLKAVLVARLEEAMANDDDGAEEEKAEEEEKEEEEEAAAPAEDAKEEEEDAPEEPADERADVQAAAAAMAEKAMADHAEKKRPRDEDQDDAEPEGQRARTDGIEQPTEPAEVDHGLTKDGQKLATYELPGGQIRKDVPTQSNEGRIIGRGGSKIRELQDRFRVRITMNRPAALAEVVGFLDGVNDCCDEITRIVEDGNVREAQEKAGLPVPSSMGSVPQQKWCLIWKTH